MRCLKQYTFLAAFLIVIHFSYSQEIRKVKIGELKTIIDTTNHPLIVNFWASWCQPCVHEIPWFEKNVKLKKDAGSNVELILVSLDFIEDYPKNIAAFAKQHGFVSRIIFLNETNADIFCPVIDAKWDGAVPASLFINKQAKYKKFYEGQLPEPQFKIALDELIR